MAGRDVVMAGAGDDFIAWNDPTGDVVFGGRGNDTILGGNVAADEIHGGAGDDLIRAFATSPESATASDRLFGDAGDDTVIGGNAADTIEGGRGDDFLTGNDGADVFIFRDNGTGDDIITDFDPSEDVVQLVGFDASFDPLAALSATARALSWIWVRATACCSWAAPWLSSAPTIFRSSERSAASVAGRCVWPLETPGRAGGLLWARAILHAIVKQQRGR